MKLAIFQNMKFGGAMRASHEIAKGLAQRGHELHLFRYRYDKRNEDFHNVPRVSENPLSFSNIATVHELPDPRLQRYLRGAFLGWRIKRAVKTINLLRDLKAFERRARVDARAIDELECDAVLLHLCCFTNAPLLLKYLQTPSLWFCHEPTRGLFETANSVMDTGKSLWERIYRKRRRTLEISTATAADTILCNSYFSREFILRSYGIDAKVVRLGVDTEKFVPGNVPKVNQVICWGPLWPAKGLEFIIRSVAQIPNKHRPNVVFPWARGSWAYHQKLVKLSEELGVTVELPKGLSDRELLVQIQKSKACVYAPHMELLGLVALEAMAAGLPVVAVREGGVRETVLDGKAGFLCVRDEEQFARSLMKLLENSELREKIGKNTAAYIREEWTWEQTARRIEKLIADISDIS